MAGSHGVRQRAASGNDRVEEPDGYERGCVESLLLDSFGTAYLHRNARIVTDIIGDVAIVGPKVGVPTIIRTKTYASAPGDR